MNKQESTKYKIVHGLAAIGLVLFFVFSATLLYIFIHGGG